MGGKMRNQILVAILGLTIVVVGLVGLFIYMYNRIDDSSLSYIEEAQHGPNQFNDIANTINVRSADDVGYSINGRYNISIHYGDMVIDVNKKAFFDEDFQRRLRKVGVEIKYKENEETGDIIYKVTYWGEPVDQYEKVS